MNMLEALTTLLEATREMAAEDKRIAQAVNRVEKKIEALQANRDRRRWLIESRVSQMIRAAGAAECDICHKPYREHPYYKHHKIDDGTGRMIPWLREDCRGRLLKL